MSNIEQHHQKFMRYCQSVASPGSQPAAGGRGKQCQVLSVPRRVYGSSKRKAEEISEEKGGIREAYTPQKNNTEKQGDISTSDTTKNDGQDISDPTPQPDYELDRWLAEAKSSRVMTHSRPRAPTGRSIFTLR
jgi:hypothetical protein